MNEKHSVVEEIANDLEHASAYRDVSGSMENSFSAAYAIQDLVVEELVRRKRRKPVSGYKIAVNSRRLLEHFGLEQPITAQIFADQLFWSPARLRLEDYNTLAVEPELCAVLNANIVAMMDNITRSTVSRCIERFIPAFELVDTRGAEIPKLNLVSAIAQNVSNAGAVLGKSGIDPDDLDPETLTMRLTVNGNEHARVKGNAPQHPLDAVAWTINHLRQRNRPLLPNMIILCGTHVPPVPITGDTHVAMQMDGVGEAEFAVYTH